jgi:lysophospholipase L1-like esterase
MRAQNLNDLIAYDRGASNTGLNTENHPSYFRSSAYVSLLEDHCRFTVIMPWFNDITPDDSVSQSDAAPQHVRALIALAKELATRNPKGRIFIMNYYDGAIAPFAAGTWARGFTAQNRALYNHEIELSCGFGSLSQIPQVKCLNSNDAFQGLGDSYVIGLNPALEVLNALVYPLNDVQQSWIDEFMAENPQGLLQGDGIHLSDGGKQALSAYVVQAMQSLPPEP